MGKKLTIEEIDEHSKNMYQAFDVCSACNEVELDGGMTHISEESDNLICDECKKKTPQK